MMNVFKAINNYKGFKVSILMLIFFYPGFLIGQIMTSPEETILIKVTEAEKIVLNINKQAISVSCELGLVIENKAKLFKGLAKLEEKGNLEITYTKPYQSELVTEECQAYQLRYSNGEKIEFRIFNHAVAFRYVFDENANTHIKEELTTYTLPVKTKVWFFERNNHWKLKSYAGEWMSCDIADLPTISTQGSIQGTPLVFEFSNGTFGFISETALLNFSGMRLKAQFENKLKVNFTEEKEGFDLQGAFYSPWRILYFADDLNDLVNQNITQILAHPLNEKLFYENDWIKPGKAVWRFWSKGTGTPDEEKQMIDYAYRLKFEYSLIDAGWEKWQNKWGKLHALCEYANQFDIGIWAWKHSRELIDPKDDYFQMRSFMDSLSEIGVKGIKIDFMNSEAKPLIDFEIKALEIAAKNKLMVNFHGCQKPAGEEITFPNQLTREGIRGLELNVMKEGPISPSHNAVLPFTRLILGPGDYTPLGFSAPGPTTWAHQLATLVCFYSPFQCIAEDPELLITDKRIKPALEFIKSVPVIWDETVVLKPSDIGEQVIMARRKGDKWYIGVLNGVDKKTIRINLDFLDHKKYNAVFIVDDMKGKKIELENLNPKAILKDYNQAIPFKRMDKVVKKLQKIEIELEQGGGAVIQLSPI